MQTVFSARAVARAVVLCSIIAGLATPPAGASPPRLPIDDVSLSSVTPTVTRSAPGLPLSRNSVDQGFTVMAPIPDFPIRRTRSSYTLRLLSGPYGDVELLRSSAQSAVAQVAAAGGPTITVAPGTTVAPSNPAPAVGEILVWIVPPPLRCGDEADAAGCGGPISSFRTPERMTAADGGTITINATALAYTSNQLRHLVAHELGHAVGLGHYDPLFQGQFQVMHRSTYGNGTYGAGDRNGFAYLGTPRQPSIAFKATTNSLWAYSMDSWLSHNTWASASSGASSPSIAQLADRDTVSAVRDATGSLRVWKNTEWATGADWGLGLKAGTSPSISALPSGGWVAALQGNDGDLWVTSHIRGTMQTRLGMAPGTSPSIAALPSGNGGWVAAFQANDGNLWATSHLLGTMNTSLGMAPGTSPSVVAPAGGSWNASFQSNANDLWIYRAATASTVDTDLGMAAGSSPSMTAGG